MTATFDLQAIEEIKRLKHRYLRCVDLKRWDDVGATFATDATADYGTKALGEPVALSGRQAIIDFLRKGLDNDIITTHFAVQPEIDVDGEQATGLWPFEDTVIVPEHRIVIKGAAIYEDHYGRDGDGTWRITHTGYTRTYELMVSLDDLPSLQFLETRWGTPGADGRR
jgi:hypothetical protein